ncbi:MAG TPA: nickel/cobalt transporter [Xanthobacteraceae bacterium]|nr:nickel/cobalt transporter [Xanthobacteraceae bacterium]
MSAGNHAQRIRRFALPTVLAALLLTGAAANAWAQFGTLGGTHPAPATGFFGWLLGQQAFFYQALAGIIRQAKTNGSAYWALIGISFIYGIFHAAGPGHGKAVISSYLLANEETWRRGVTLSFASAALQSLTAIAIVAIAAVLIGGTAQLMGNTVRTIETTSYVLIIVIGARMLWVKGKSFRASLRKMTEESEPASAEAAESHAHEHSHDGHSHRDHSHDAHAEHDQAHGQHGHDAHADHAAHGHHHAHDDEEEDDILPWGHAHGPEPQDLAGPGGWRRGLSTIIAVGLRPCSGAIIVLVFALAQGLFWAGVASTFVMGLGTAITVGAIASVAVGAKSLAKRFATARSGYGSLVLRGFEVGAACLVMLVGVGLLTGYLASERMGFF